MMGAHLKAGQPVNFFDGQLDDWRVYNRALSEAEIQALFTRPGAAFSASPLSGVVPLEVMFSNGSIHASSYVWDFGDGTSSTLSSPTHTYLQPGVYTVTLAAGNGVMTDTLTRANYLAVTDAAITGLSATSDSPTVLAHPTMLTATITTGSNVTYLWTFGDGMSGSEPVVSHTYPAVGIYTAVVTATNSVSVMTATTTVTITDEGLAGLTAANDGPTELGQTTLLTATTTAGRNVTYTWDFGDGTTGSGPIVSHTYPAVGVYTAIVTASSSASVLTATTTVTVTDPPITGLVVTNDSPTELGQTTTLTATTAEGSNITYTWNFGDGTPAISSGPGVNHTYPTIGLYTAVVTASNSVSVVTATTRVTITDAAIAGLSATNDSPTLLGEATTLTATITAGSNVAYTWDFGDGATGSGPEVSHTYPAVGVYTAIVTASNSVNVVTATTPVTVTGIPRLAIGKTGPATAIAREPITYTLTVTNNGTLTATDLVITDAIPASASYISGGTKVGQVVRWTLDNLAPASSTAVELVVTATETITNNEYGVSAEGGIAATGQEAVSTLVYPPVVANFVATPLTGVAPLTVTFSNSSTGATDYLWDFGSGATLTVISPTYTYNQPGVYTVTLTASGPGGSDMLTRSNYITVTEPVVAGFSASPLTGTVPLTVTFVNSSTGASSHLWDFGDGNTSTVISPTHTYTQAGVYTVSLSVSDSLVTDTLSQTNYITVYEPVIANFAATPLTGLVPLTVTFVNSSTGALDYLWDFGNGATLTVISPTYTYNQPGVYTVTLTASGPGGSNTLTRTQYITVTAPIIRDWELITTTTAPPIKGEHSMAYDSVRDVVVLYGGNATGWPYEDTTWEFDGTDWNVITTTLSPAARYGTSLAYDPVRQVMVLFGGGNQKDRALNQTWTYGNTEWVNVSPGTSPLSRTYASMATNPVSGTIYLFGGNEYKTYFNDLWRYEDGAWTEITPNGDAPPARTLAAMTYVPSLLAGGTEGGLLLFGGRTVTGMLLADLWAFDPVSETWTELDDGSGEGPSERMAHSLSYDLGTGKVVLVGGITDEGDTRLGDTWHYTPLSSPPPGGTQEGWTEANPTTLLPPRAYHQAVYTNNAILLFSARQLWRYK